MDRKKRLEELRRKKLAGYRHRPEKRSWAIWRSIRDENAAYAGSWWQLNFTGATAAIVIPPEPKDGWVSPYYGFGQ